MGLIGLTHAEPVHEEERPLAKAPPGRDWTTLAKVAAAVLVPCAVAYGLHRSSEPEGLDAAEVPRASGVASSGAGVTLERSMRPDGAPPEHAFQAGSFGHSNAVRVKVVLPNEVIALPMTFADNTTGLQSQWIAFDGKPNEPVVPWRADGGIRTPSRPGAFWLVLSRAGVADTIADLALFVEVPMPNKMATGINGYHMGRWPKAADNIVPRGFIEVTQRTADFPLTPHLKMSDFVVHDAQDGFPKYLHVREKLLDKVELVLAEIAQMRGRTVSALTLHVASGFRSPAHNGVLSGSAQDSRHMYGDAVDIGIDVNNDGTLNEVDARLVAAAAEVVERAHPDLIGGIGLYFTADGAGWPYVHIDTRGTRARWRGGAKKGTVDSLPDGATFDSTAAPAAAVKAAPAGAAAAAPPAAVPAATPAPVAPAAAPRAKPDSAATTSSTFAGVTAPAPVARAALVKTVSATTTPVAAAPAPVSASVAPRRAAPAPSARGRTQSASREPTRVVAVTGSSDEPTVVALAGPRTPSRRPARVAASAATSRTASSRTAASRSATARKPAATKAAPPRRATPAAGAARRKGVVASAGRPGGTAAARNRSRPAASTADDPFASAARRFRATRP